MNPSLSETLRELAAPFSGRPAMVHSDLFVAAKLLPPTDRTTGESRENRRTKLLQDHTAFLDSLNLELQVPVFNYQFLKTGFTDLRSAPAELGPLNQFMLNHWAAERTFDPVFSFAVGAGAKFFPQESDEMIAFGEATLFAELVRREGLLLMYGPPLSAMTLIHHLEHLAGEPLYRYDKMFHGTIVTRAGNSRTVNYRYHVRPRGKHLDYDWAKLRAHLIARGLWHAVTQDGKEIAFLIPVKEMMQTFLAEIRRDPLYLLDAESRFWVEPMVDKLQRRFLQSDFES